MLGCKKSLKQASVTRWSGRLITGDSKVQRIELQDEAYASFPGIRTGHLFHTDLDVQKRADRADIGLSVQRERQGDESAGASQGQRQ